MLILSNTKNEEERTFYLKLAVKEKYSVRELNRQLQSSYYQRYMLSDGSVPKSTTKILNEEDDFLHTRILDTYSLEFLDLPNEFSEKGLKTAIIKNLKDFILEVEYSMSKNMSQTMISEYKFKLIDKKLLEYKLKEVKNLIENSKQTNIIES